jgi:hypothetical protein
MKMYLQIPRQQRSRSLGSYLAALPIHAKAGANGDPETAAKLRTFRDGNSQVTKFFERGTDEKAVTYEHRAAAEVEDQSDFAT